MPKYDVSYSVTITRNYTYTVSATSEETAEEKVVKVIEAIESINKFPGDLDNEEIDFVVYEVHED